MAKSFTDRKRIRKSFGRITEVAPLPNLIEVQKSSYDLFLHPREEGGTSGLQEVFVSVFPIKDFADRSQLEYVRYRLKSPNMMWRNASNVA
jgi:DNA-directed RNA polymerase subunit beta